MSETHPPCYNRPPYRDHALVQIGWTEDGRRVMSYIEDNMSKGCQQWERLGEARLKGWDCDGCKWKRRTA